MRKVGSFTGPVGVAWTARASSLRLIVAGTVALAAALFVVAVSGAAPGTDATVKNFQQCANGAPPSTATDCPDGWINGILQSSNSHYAEDEVTPQRVILVLPKDGPLTGRTVEIKYLTRKGGVHAYDSLATWDHTQTTADRCSDLNPADCVADPDPSTFAIPSDPTVVADKNGSGSATSGHQLSSQFMTMYGGEITGVSVPSHGDPSGTSDEEATVTVTYSVADLSADRKVMLLFGGHIAASLGPRGWGAGVGAGSISGGPYHIKICKVDDDSSGCRDNQIMSGAILAPANIVIHKVAVGGDATFGYTATGGISSPFSITTSGGTGSRSFTSLTAGSYTVTESAPPTGWDFTSLQCVDEDGGTSASGQTANIDLDPGETVTCTYTNTKRGQIIVDKVTAPSGDPQSFAFTLTGGPDSINQSFSLADATTPHDSGLVRPGTYAASETSVPAGWDLTSATCSGGSAPGSIALAAGETVTCTFTNTKRATLVVYKQVVNDNGGSAVASAWQMNVSGPTTLNFAGSATGTSNQVLPGSYSVGESGGPGGYAGPSYPTSGLPAGVAQNDCNGAGAVSIGPGETKRCVLRNDDRAATLIVRKVVVNDNGGAATADDFSFEVNGGAAQSFEADGQNNLTVNAGTYSVSEPAVAGYATSYDNCTDIVLGLGQTATCTITNDDQAATLIVRKVVVNDNGGAATADDFSFQVNGGAAQPFEADGQNNLTVNAGTYSVSEPAVAGYATSYDNCSNVVIPNGGTATCTITNDDSAATLIVRKVVVNDNGGAATADDFSFRVNGGQAQPFEADGQNNLTVNAGTYGVTEPAVAGYTTSYDNCSNLVIPNGGSATCTITNDDQSATLIVKKVVVNDDGGAATADDFSFRVNGGQAQPFEADGQNNLTVDAGTYDVTEPAVEGYSTSYDNCSDVVIPNGGSATCTVTNDDDPATLIVEKVVVNDDGGTNLASDFSFQVNGGEPESFEADGQNELEVDAGTYDVTEPAVAGYETSYDNCSELVIPNGGSATCTITNDDLPATLIVRKVVVNDDGGTATAEDFSFQVNGGQAQPFEADGQNELIVNAGSYEVNEPAVAGYTTSYQGCEEIVLSIGGTATCTITNNDVPRGKGSITVNKSASPTTLKEPGGPVTYSVTITNTSADVMVSIQNVVDDRFGDLDDSGGNGCFDVPVNLAPGKSVNCTFQKTISGAGGSSHVNVVTASGVDENGNKVSDSDDARVDITPRLIDLVVVKEATSPTALNGIVNYSLTVTNKGPDTATNVQLADPAPAGITYLSATTSQGTCSVSSALVTCSLGDLAAGQTVTIQVRGRATSVGSHTNTATVTGSGGRETNPADNVDSAVTIVPAPLKPPKPKPKPEPQPEFCLALTVSPKMIKADGKPDRVVVTVTAGSKRVKGVKVVVRGAGVSKTARTNGKGVAVLRINPRKAGLITVSVAESNRKLCGPKRIGVVGVFLPPLTG